MAFAPAVAVAHQIAGNGIEPGGEFLTGIELRAVLIDASEGFLGQVRRVLLVLQGANQIVKEPLRMALHQMVQGLLLAGGQSRHFLAVMQVGG